MTFKDKWIRYEMCGMDLEAGPYPEWDIQYQLRDIAGDTRVRNARIADESIHDEVTRKMKELFARDI